MLVIGKFARIPCVLVWIRGRVADPPWAEEKGGGDRGAAQGGELPLVPQLLPHGGQDRVAPEREGCGSRGGGRIILWAIHIRAIHSLASEPGFFV